MNDSQGKGLWPKTICVCLACGEWDRTDIQLRSFPTCHDGDSSYHGPTQTVEILPASLSEELADHLQNCLDIADPRQMIDPFDEAREFLKHYRETIGETDGR